MSAAAEAPALCVTGVGLVCALGSDPAEVVRQVRAGESGVSALDALGPLGQGVAGGELGAAVAGPSVRPWLKRRKDRKLMARPSVLALAAAGLALDDWEGERDALGVFFAVGREPPDDGTSEPALAAAERDGALDDALLAGPGRDRYPPLLPLKTLPNMALAHVSIHLGLTGENGAWTGGWEAGWQALYAAWWAVAEGRCGAALVGGADSLVDLGSARDRLRAARLGSGHDAAGALAAAGPPGEAGAMLILEPEATALARGARVWARLGALPPQPSPDIQRACEELRGALGDCGAAELPLAAVLAAAAGESDLANGSLQSWLGSTLAGAAAAAHARAGG